MITRFMLVDPHEIMRRGVAAVLSAEADMELAGQFAFAEEAVASAADSKPDVVVIDVYTPGISGLEAIVLLREHYPDAAVLILTASEQGTDLHEALRVGARGYVLKGMAPEELVTAVRQVARGWVAISPDMAGKITNDRLEETWERGAGRGAAGEALSMREWDVLQLLAEGMSNREIADQLVVSENTVKTHMRSILSKLRLRNRAEVAAFARQLRRAS